MSDILDEGCSCHVSPPCRFCVETYECEQCHCRVIGEDQDELAASNQLCDECLEKAPQIDPRS